MSLRTLAALAAMAIALAATREADAFCRTTTCNETTEECLKNDRGCVRSGVTVKWAKLPITYRFYEGGSSKLNDKKMRAAITSAFSAWESVKCPNGGATSVQFAQGPDIRTDKPVNKKQASQPFGIYFRDDEWPYKSSSDSLALTNQIYGEKGGVIDYADIEINTAEGKFSLSDTPSDDTDFEAVVIHEAGHYLGLAHSEDNDSIMAPVYCQSAKRCSKQDVEAKRKLSADDIEGVCAIYPPSEDPDGTSGSSVPSTSGCAQTSRTPSNVASGFALVFLASAITRRRLRSSP